MPLISVIMPVYNSETYLAESIESVLNQTLPDFELLVVYDKSTDNSLEIIERYQQRDERIKLIFSNMKTLVGALNQGIDAAQGKFIARMDSDDISLPLRFEKQVDLMNSACADICGCHFIVINNNGNLINTSLVPLFKSSFIMYLGYGVPFAHGSVMMRSTFLKKNSLHYDSLKSAEDYDLWIRFFEKNAVFANVNDFLFKYRKTDVSLINRAVNENANDTKYLQIKFVNQNKNEFLLAINELLKRHVNLSEDEQKTLLMSSYLASIKLKCFIFFKVLKHSSIKRKAIFFLQWLKGV